MDLHEVLLAVNKAELTFKAMMQVRNKLLDAYRDIIRMGV
ncbi:MAG: flagellar hook-basal body complex protein FliE [Acidobacteriota bacterium]